MTFVPWSVAMARANNAFYSRQSPDEHFRTSMVAARVMARALFVTVQHTDIALGHPDVLDLVDIGAAGGDLLNALMQQADRDDPDLARRLRPHGIDLRSRPSGLDPRAVWTQGSVPAALGEPISGVVIAHEWLDDQPIEVYSRSSDGSWLGVEVDPNTGRDRTFVVAEDDIGLTWLTHSSSRSFDAPVGARLEAGHLRDACWSAVADLVTRGLLVAIDYGSAHAGPAHSTLVGFAKGGVQAPVPDGSMNITADVALHSCARAAEEALTNRGVRSSSGIVTQREALAALLADEPTTTDRWADLAATTQRAELTNVNGLGAHLWLGQAVGIALPRPWV